LREFSEGEDSQHLQGGTSVFLQDGGSLGKKGDEGLKSAERGREAEGSSSWVIYGIVRYSWPGFIFSDNRREDESKVSAAKEERRGGEHIL